MKDTRYLRSQAALCMRVAEQAADPNLAGSFRDAGASYFAQAVRIEADRLGRATTSEDTQSTSIAYPAR